MFGRAVKRTKVENIRPTVDFGIEAKCELDSRADTSCAGINCRPIHFTGQQCEVNGFHNKLEPITDVPIATVATAWSDPFAGTTYILIINEALYFGDSLDHSLINPNQVRHYGLPLYDNPYETDPDRAMGIILDDRERLPFTSEGSTVYFNTRYPTDEELELYPHVVLTCEQPWDPKQLVMPGGRPTHPTDELDRFVQRVESDVSHDFNRHHHMYETDFIFHSLYDDTEQVNIERIINSIHSTASTSTAIAELQSKTRHSIFSPEHIARVFNVGLGMAKDILRTTTQEGVRHAVRPLNRRYRVDHLNLHHNYLAGKWTLDHIESKYKSIRQHTGAFVISNGNYVAVYPTASKNDTDATESLRRFCTDVGVPVNLKSDMAATFTGRNTGFTQMVRKHGINMTWSEPDRHNQLQQVDVAIRDLKRRWRHKMSSKNVPRRLWCFGVEHQAQLMQFIPRGRNDRSGYEVLTGRTPDISEFCDFDFYDLVWYWRAAHPSLSEHDRELARWMGVAHRVGSDMCYWLMPVSGKPVVNTTVQHVTSEDYQNPQIKLRIDDFNNKLHARLDDTDFVLPGNDLDFNYPNDVYEIPIAQDAENGDRIDENGDIEQRPEADDVDSYDNLIGATFLLDPLKSPNNVATRATVIRRKTDHLGNPIGKAHSNPLLDTREYEVELEDGTYDSYFANTIAENLWSQCDAEGRQFNVIRGIIGHKSDGHAVKKEDGYYMVGGQKRAKKTTAGWKLEVEFSDGTSDWLPLRDVKESNPIELAEYAIASCIDQEPAFLWWVPLVIRKRNRMVNKVKKKYWRTTHKFGIRLPKTVAEALRFDKENGNTYWADAMSKEMGKAKVSFNPMDGCTPEQVRANKIDELRGFQEIKCHIVFDVKMDFTRKARFVAGGHTTEAPNSLTYSSVVSRESVKIAFLIAALNELDIMACDIGNAYLNAPCREKIWFVAGPECGPDTQGMVCKLVRALYGLKSSGAAWRAMFSAFIVNGLKFSPTRADPDVYIRKNYRDGGRPYYEYLLVYVDDVLVISAAPEEVMKSIGTEFEIKNDEYGPPTTYLGAGISKVQLSGGTECWSMDSKKYVKAAIETIRNLLLEDGRELKSGTGGRQTGPLPPSYRPELDQTPMCDEDHASRYRQIIGIYRWAVELGRFDILTEVSLLSQYQASPRVGHLEALYLIANYLVRFPVRRLVFNPIPAEIDETVFTPGDWRDFYGDVVEEDPPNMPVPLGNPVTMSCFVDADHAGNKVTRRSHTGIIIFLQQAPVQVFSKRQNTCESSSYGSELVAMRIARDLISAMRIKLKCFGVPINGPCNVFCDNNAVVKNTSIPESVLQKKHNAINYHIIREAVAAGILRIGKEDTETNIADAFTKLMEFSRKFKLLHGFLWER